MSEKAPFMVFSGTNSRYLAEKICASLDCPLGKMNITHFADGEFAVSYEESIRGSHVFLVQSTFPNSDNLMELLLMVDAAKRASAKSVVAVIPYFGWARQDRKDKPRVSIGAKLVADLLSVAGIDRLRWTFMQTRFKVSSIFRWIICMHQQYSSPILNP
jgi:ribose-phosphate pyrophosphokinase